MVEFTDKIIMSVKIALYQLKKWQECVLGTFLVACFMLSKKTVI